MITIYSSDSTGIRGNCLYPYRHEVTDAAGLREAVMHDYVCAEYKNSYRSGGNFITSNCLGMDCDNDHTDHEHEWITPDDVRRNFPDVPLAIHFSRHHMKPKDQKSARPRFHCLFAIEPTTDVKAYADMKARLNALFPYFDAQALDGARFFFGTDDPEIDFFPGTITLNECLERYYPEEDSFANLPDGTPQGRTVIQEGSRNRTMSVFAGKILKRYGDTDQTHDLFLQEAAKCDPPLPDEELATIWRSARSFYQRISSQPDYVPPEKYNADTPDDFAFRPADDTDVGEARMLADVFYVKPRIGENQFGSPAATYMGLSTARQWDRLESYGPKFVENIVQAISRDVLCYAMQTLRCCSIVAHVHDELIIEVDSRMSLEAVCEQMGRTPPWAPGLQLRADGYATDFYKKD